MKNIHVLPTDKPSRLSILNSGKLNFGAEAMSSSNSKLQHIYITNDEEIKEGDWCYDKVLNLIFQTDNHTDFKYANQTDNVLKIILTTDQDLIADGVQAIDDEFLEWFAENPSCESIEVEKYFHEVGDAYDYEIIIPKEEPKQETLEEAAKRTYQKGLKDDLSLSFHNGVKFGAEWQAERMYSEEDMKKAFIEGHNVCRCVTDNTDEAKECFNNWFEQFKKK